MVGCRAGRRWPWLTENRIRELERQQAGLKPKPRSCQMVPLKFKRAGYRGSLERRWSGLQRMTAMAQLIPGPLQSLPVLQTQPPPRLSGKLDSEGALTLWRPDPSLAGWWVPCMSGHQADILDRRQTSGSSSSREDLSSQFLANHKGHFPFCWRSSYWLELEDEQFP